MSHNVVGNGSATEAGAGPAPRLLSAWERFWHQPVRAERLALMRILLGVALLTDQLFQYLPNLMEFFGPTGVAPQGLHDNYQLRHWHWTVLLFNTDDPAVLYPVFWAWVGVTLAWTVGFCTRLMNVAVWFLTMCFLNRNPDILNGGDDTLQVGIILLLISPCGAALSVDSWLRRRLGGPAGPTYTPAWPVRVLQIQLCLIYLGTGIPKLAGDCTWDPLTCAGTWWEGTSIHYVLNYVTMGRWSYAQLPVPFWLTAALTYVCVWWEVLFPLLVLIRWTRKWALLFGLLFHLGIYFTIEVGWFSFYTMSFYGVWVPDSFWERLGRRAGVTAPAQGAAALPARAPATVP
jgi:uncharacterized membrane protein YphA (DoxX/SURF4 family)